MDSTETPKNGPKGIEAINNKLSEYADAPSTLKDLMLAFDAHPALREAWKVARAGPRAPCGHERKMGGSESHLRSTQHQVGGEFTRLAGR